MWAISSADSTVGHAMTVVDIATLVGVGAAVISTFYGALTYHRPKATATSELSITSKARQTPPWPIVLVLIAWAAVAFNYYEIMSNRPTSTIPPDPSQVLLQSWGVFPPATYQITINSHQLLEYKDTFKLFLITRTGFSDVDRLTDAVIEKSRAFSIDGGIMAVAHQSENKLRFLLGGPTIIEYDLVMIPSRFSEDNITTLHDVESLGGRILASASQLVTTPPPPPLVAQQLGTPCTK